MADTKVKDLTEKAIGAATDQVYLNDVVGGNLDKRMPLSGIRVTESQITDLQTYLLINPALGTPVSGALTNCTSIPAGSLTGSIADARLSANVPLIDGNNAFTGDNTFSNASNPLITEKTGTVTNTFLTPHQVIANTSNDMVDGFGPRMLFRVEDSAAGPNTMGGLAFVRDGSDTQGKLLLSVNTTLDPVLSIATDGTTDWPLTGNHTNFVIDANGTGNSITNIDVADLANGTDGELITWDAAGAPATVAAGTATHVLTSNGAGAAPTFQANPAGFADPMTTRGDLIYKNAAGTTVRLPAGAASEVLVSDGTDIAWGAAGAADNLGDHTATEIIKSVTFGLQGEEAGHTIIGTTASGAWTYTAPAADTHDFVVTGTGTIAQVAAAGLDVTGVITVSSTVDGRDIATDGTKLDGIEALADVTDITNVNAAAATTVGTITTGVWNGTTIAVANGGTGVTSSTGTTNVVLSGSPTIVTPTIASLTNMQHDHADAAGGGTLDVSAITAGSSLVEAAIPFVIDGGGSAITGAEIRGDVEVPFDCTIKSVRMFADQSGSIVVDIWKDTYANFPPTDADSITASAVPTISTAVKSEDATLTGWTTTLSKGDILRFNVDSATTVERVTVSLLVDRT